MLHLRSCDKTDILNENSDFGGIVEKTGNNKKFIWRLKVDRALREEGKINIILSKTIFSYVRVATWLSNIFPLHSNNRHISCFPEQEIFSFSRSPHITSLCVRHMKTPVCLSAVCPERNTLSYQSLRKETQHSSVEIMCRPDGTARSKSCSHLSDL